MAKRDHGRDAERPLNLGRSGWKDVLGRVKARVKENNLGLVAGGVSFFAFLALFPALAAIVSIYGLFADPQDVEAQLMALGEGVPEGVRDILGQQMNQLAAGAPGALGWGVFVSLLLALWSANKGTKNLVTALNIAYEEPEERGFIRRNAITLALTLGGVVAVVLAVGIIVVIPAMLGQLGFADAGRVAVDVLRWPLLAGLLLVGLGVLYRFGPDRDHPQWRWVGPGTLTAVVLLLAVSLGFSIYVANFGNYNEVYGSLGAVAILLLWLYLSAFVVLLGAEINAEAERQTRKDTTVGRPEPMGKRRAHSADTLGESRPSN